MRKPKRVSNRLLVVAWLDAWADFGDSKATDWPASCPVETVGWERECPPIGHEDCDNIHLVAEVFPDKPDEYRTALHIPRSMVVSVTKMKENP